MKKVVAYIVTFLVTITSLGGIANAEVRNIDDKIVLSSQEDSEVMNIRLNEIVVNTSDYKSEDVIIETNDNEDGVVEVKIIDKETNKVLEVMTEKRGRELRNGEYHNIITRSRYDGPVTTTLEVNLLMYSYNSYRQINAINGTKIFASSSSYTTLEDGSAYSTVPGNKFPATSVTMSGSGVITGKTTSSTSGEFSIEFLKSAGFSVTQTTSSEYSYRKYVTITSSYSIY